jgi:hypothetical protein
MRLSVPAGASFQRSGAGLHPVSENRFWNERFGVTSCEVTSALGETHGAARPDVGHLAAPVEKDRLKQDLAGGPRR